MDCTRLFEPDDDFDTDYASDGVSRYGAYLAQYASLFRDDADLTADAGRFAAAAWRIAYPPTMSPGYVWHHGRVQRTGMTVDDDGRLAITVDLAVSRPHEAAGLGQQWRGWQRDDFGRWWEPDDLTSSNAVTLLRAAVPVAGLSLPRPRYHDGRPDTTAAKRAVQAICALVNTELAAILSADALIRTRS